MSSNRSSPDRGRCLNGCRCNLLHPRPLRRTSGGSPWPSPRSSNSTPRRPPASRMPSHWRPRPRGHQNIRGLDQRDQGGHVARDRRVAGEHARDLRRRLRPLRARRPRRSWPSARSYAPPDPRCRRLERRQRPARSSRPAAGPRPAAAERPRSLRGDAPAGVESPAVSASTGPSTARRPSSCRPSSVSTRQRMEAVRPRCRRQSVRAAAFGPRRWSGRLRGRHSRTHETEVAGLDQGRLSLLAVARPCACAPRARSQRLLAAPA